MWERELPVEVGGGVEEVVERRWRGGGEAEVLERQSRCALLT